MRIPSPFSDSSSFSPQTLLMQRVTLLNKVRSNIFNVLSPSYAPPLLLYQTFPSAASRHTHPPHILVSDLPLDSLNHSYLTWPGCTLLHSQIICMHKRVLTLDFATPHVLAPQPCLFHTKNRRFADKQISLHIPSFPLIGDFC